MGRHMLLWTLLLWTLAVASTAGIDRKNENRSRCCTAIEVEVLLSKRDAHRLSVSTNETWVCAVSGLDFDSFACVSALAQHNLSSRGADCAPRLSLEWHERRASELGWASSVRCDSAIRTLEHRRFLYGAILGWGLFVLGLTVLAMLICVGLTERRHHIGAAILLMLIIFWWFPTFVVGLYFLGTQFNVITMVAVTVVPCGAWTLLVYQPFYQLLMAGAAAAIGTAGIPLAADLVQKDPGATTVPQYVWSCVGLFGSALLNCLFMFVKRMERRRFVACVEAGIVECLSRGDIRLLSVAWLLRQPVGFRLRKRQEMPEEAYVQPEEAMLLLGRAVTCTTEAPRIAALS